MSPRRARIRPAGAGPSTGDRPRCRHRPGRSAVTAEHPSPRPVCELLFELSSVAGAAAGAYVAAPPRALAISMPSPACEVPRRLRPAGGRPRCGPEPAALCSIHLHLPASPCEPKQYAQTDSPQYSSPQHLTLLLCQSLLTTSDPFHIFLLSPPYSTPICKPGGAPATAGRA